MGVVDSTKLISEAWNNVYSILNTHLTDPKNRGVKWIWSAFPVARKGTADVFPCVVIESPDLSGANIIFGHSKREYTWSILISVYAKRMEYCDTVSDDVLEQLETYKGSLDTWNMQMLNFISSPTMHAVVDGQVIHEKRIEIEMRGLI